MPRYRSFFLYSCIVKHVEQCKSPSGASLIFVQDLHVKFFCKMFRDKYIPTYQWNHMSQISHSIIFFVVIAVQAQQVHWLRFACTVHDINFTEIQMYFVVYLV